MNDEDIRRLLKLATPGPWYEEGEGLYADLAPPLDDGTPDPGDDGGGWTVCEGVQHGPDRTLMAQARYLAIEVLNLRAHVNALERVSGPAAGGPDVD